MLHEYILALPNWPGIGAVKVCVQPWAVSSQHTNDAPIWYSVSKARHGAGTKGLLNTLLEQRDFLKGLGPICLERARQDVAPLTGHHIHRCLV